MACTLTSADTPTNMEPIPNGPTHLLPNDTRLKYTSGFHPMVALPREFGASS